MEARRLVPLPSPDQRTATPIRVEGERIIIDQLTIRDPGLAAFVVERPESERATLVERALRIGLVALQDVGVTVNVDVVRREFGALLSQTEAANERAAKALDDMLRTNFSDGDGRLPRTLEKFLGDRGALRSFVTELFDETKRDSAIGRMRQLLGDYFDGDASRLAVLLDPTRLGSPLHQFRSEVSAGFTRLNERLTAIEAAAAARATERQRSAAKGADFESLLASMLGEIVRGSGDVLDRTGDEAGGVARSKKGDFVLTVSPDQTRGAELRVVIEAKDRTVSGRLMRDELREAKVNRGAAVGLVIFTPNHAPSGIAPFDVRAGDVYCVVDPDAPEPANLEGAVRLARLLALACLREDQQSLDGAAVGRALEGIREQLEGIRQMKTQLTSIGTTAQVITIALDRMRTVVLSRIDEVEAELRLVDGSPAA
ncbi:MAG: hypothetical protein H0W07_02540 [Chloroflexi bacterium]|nr:hypothetical protein [Chloroflexota bacterium]